MFKSEANLFLSANNNVGLAKNLINECKALILDFDLAGNSDCANLKSNINNCDINSLVTKVEETKESLMKLDESFAEEYMSLLAEYLNTSTLNMSEEDLIQYNLCARDYNYNLLYMLEKAEENGMLTEEMKQQLEYQRILTSQYEIQDKMSILAPDTQEYIDLFEQNAELDRVLINLNPNLTPEEKESYLNQYNVQYNQTLENLKNAKDSRDTREKNEKELAELYETKENNSDFFHPFLESEIDEAILDKKIEMGIATEDEIAYKNMNGLDRFLTNTETFTVSTFTGLFNITEGISDAAVMLSSLFGNAEYKTWASEYISKDISGELYDGIVLSTDMNSYSAYGKYHTSGEWFGGAVGKVGITFASPWVSAILYGADAMGQSAETAFNNGDEYWTAFGKSFVSGIGGALEGYGFAKLNININNFVSSGALETLKGTALASIKKFSSTLTSQGGLKIIGGNLLNLVKSGVKKIPLVLKQGGIELLKDVDAMVETGCVLANDIIECATTGEWDVKKILKDSGAVLLVNYFMSFVTTMAFDVNTKKPNIDEVADPNLYDGQPTDNIFDSDPTDNIFGVEDTVATTTVAAAKSNSRTFNTYDEFVAANRQVRTQWEAGLTDRQKTLIRNYIGESDVSSYATMNGIARGTCINPDAGTVTFYHAFGGPHTYTFAEYAAEYGESVSDLYTRTLKESAELDAAIRQCRLPQDTIIARGMDANALSRFGIDTKADSAETIMAKLGGTYSDAGFMSSTPVSGGGFTHKDINLIMDCPAGSACADFATFNPHEQEVLFPMGQEFNVDNVVKKDDKIYIYMTLKGGA